MPTLNPNDYAYLWSPTRQMLDKNGKPLVSGYVQLNQHGTTGTPAESYSDWNGTLNARNILLDSLGRAAAIVENDKLYDMYVYNRYNVLEYSALGVNCSGEGGDSSIRFTSSDGSIVITRINNSVDLKVHSEESAYGTGTGSSVDSQGLIQFDNVEGNITLISANTLSLNASKVYHVTLQLELSTATTTDSYIDATVNDSENGVHKFQIDGSKTYQYVDISWDLYSTKNYAKFYANLPASVSVTAATLYIHAVNSVTVGESGGGGETYTAGDGINISPENIISADYTKVQPKLVAGDGISIDQSTNTISATGSFSQVQADWDETDTSDPSYIQNKPDLDQYAKTADLAPVALSNDYTDLNNRPSIPVVNDGTLTIQKNGSTIDTFSANSSANKTVNIAVPTKTSDITNDSGFITASDIPAQVNADWNASSGVAQILNKPSIPVVGTITL